MKNNIFRFGQWQVSPGTNSIVNGAERRQMEPRAMDVLMALCERPAAVISATELLERCWSNSVHGDNPVHKTIAQLRRVLGDNTAAPIYIETIRKRGYRTVAELVRGPVLPVRQDATMNPPQTTGATARTGSAKTAQLRAALGGALLEWPVDQVAVFPGTGASASGLRLADGFESGAGDLQRTIFSSTYISAQDRQAFLSVLDSMAHCECVILVVASRSEF